MEDALVQINLLYLWLVFKLVLILVLMEDALVQLFYFYCYYY